MNQARQRLISVHKHDNNQAKLINDHLSAKAEDDKLKLQI